MPITAQAIVSDARTLLQDTKTIKRWSDAEMLSWINNGRRDMATLQPTYWGQLAKRTVQLAAGAYQTLPTLGVSDAFGLADVLNNTTVAGVPTDAIRLTDRATLDAFEPGWRSATGSAVENWFRDDANSMAFWVYPSVTNGRIDINVRVNPTDLTALTQQAVPLDVMATTLMHYVLYRAYSKDAEVAQNAQLATNYFNLFTAAVAAKG